MQVPSNEASYLAPLLTFFGGIAVHELGRRLLFPKKENGNGNYSARMELDMRKAMKDTIDDSILPILSNQTQILQQVAQATSRMSDAVVELTVIERNRAV